LFGSEAQLEGNKSSLLVGVSKCNISKDSDTYQDLDDIKEFMLKDMPPIMETLVDRVFIFDGAERGDSDDGFWCHAECLRQIEGMSPISDPGSIFRTVLTDSDEKVQCY
jgi:hypothetical protein